jgi:pyruvate/2-oxoglutarate dehydrogenase complex dihydrolipoamide dehydrogenase (E3) component
LFGVKGLTSTSQGRSQQTSAKHQTTVLSHSEEHLQFLPHDDYNATLVSHVYPTDYLNPSPSDEYDLVVIGAGVAGLLSVITAKWLGKRCALIESDAMGGDCLNIGCVPSKAFIASAKILSEIKSASKFGINIPLNEVSVDFSAIMTRMRKIRSEISTHDSVARYSREFCEHVYLGKGIFSSEHLNTVIVTDQQNNKSLLRYKKAMIATGASPSIPLVLQDIPHLTNKNFFNLLELPPRIVAIGCGPVSLELSQALAIFGSQVICIESGEEILHREDIDAAKLLHQLLEQDGFDTLSFFPSYALNRGHFSDELNCDGCKG